LHHGLGIWKWASNDEGNPEVVMACCGDVPTMEALAAVMLLRERVPDLRIRVVNVVDLMALQPHPSIRTGCPTRSSIRSFPPDVPTIFAFHGYPWLIHRLTYRRHNHDNIHVRGYKEEGTTTTPFDMCVLNNIDRFQLTLDAIKRVPRLARRWMRRAVVLRADSAAQAVCGRKRRRPAGDQELALAGEIAKLPRSER
jgi:xylulose-5-phosphate/fructose-6-phosphate phosphoketolase